MTERAAYGFAVFRVDHPDTEVFHHDDGAAVTYSIPIGEPLASGEGSDVDAVTAQALHYVAVYGQDGRAVAVVFTVSARPWYRDPGMSVYLSPAAPQEPPHG